MSEPVITTRAYHVSSGSNDPVHRLVVHATCPPNVPFPTASQAGQARGTALYFTSPSSGGSAHYVHDVASEEHCVPEDAIAWHAPPNSHSIGFEICGLSTYTRDQWLSPQVWPACLKAAARISEVAARRGIPLVRLSVDDVRNDHWGICGHVDVSQAFHQSDHTDPGPNFPWPEFMAAVTGVGPAPVPQPQPTPVVVDIPAITFEDSDVQYKEVQVVITAADKPGAGNGWTSWDTGAPVRGFSVSPLGPYPPDDGYWDQLDGVKVKAQRRGNLVIVTVKDAPPGSVQTVPTIAIN